MILNHKCLKLNGKKRKYKCVSEKSNQKKKFKNLIQFESDNKTVEMLKLEI